MKPMINLDDPSAFKEIDRSDMLSHIVGLPSQVQNAWELGRELPLPPWEGIERVVVAGMGGSAIGADLVAAYTASTCRVPLIVHRNYSLPAWAEGPGTLVLASSHSGNTEETLDAFKTALARGCLTLALATGGELARSCQASGSLLWRFEHTGQPRAAVGFSAGLLLAALARLGLIPNPEDELRGAVQAMAVQAETLAAGVPAAGNPAKRMAGQLFGRWVTVVGADLLEPVARRWKTQINEVAKAWASFEPLPEADHNTLAGSANPEDAVAHTMVLFLRAPSCHPRNQLRTNLTKKAFMLEGLNTDFIDAAGDTPLAHQWTTLHFGDYTAYYLAMAYGVDPTAIPAIEMFKSELG
jgi:glucose/mannose-6-phosphate isomerase